MNCHILNVLPPTAAEKYFGPISNKNIRKHKQIYQCIKA